MGEVFHDYVDDAVPNFEFGELQKYDSELYGGEEEDTRARFFQHVARELRQNKEELQFFHMRNFYRMRQLKTDLAGVCNQLDDTTSELRRERISNQQLEKENGELIEQVSGLSVALVNASFERDRRSRYATNKMVNSVMIAVFLVVVAYLCPSNFRIRFSW